MTIPPILVGAMLGLLLGIGLLMVVLNLPGVRRVDPGRRIDPYLRSERLSVLWDAPAPAGRARRQAMVLAGPLARRMLGVLESLTGGSEQLRRRLRLAGRRTSPDEFRIEQVLWGSAGMVGGFALAAAAVTLRGTSPVVGLAIVVLGALLGVLGRDYVLGLETKRRASRMAREFPTVADLLALAVAAGESPMAAMERVASSSRGALSRELAATVAEVRAGATAAQALGQLGERTPLDAIGRFGEGVAVAIERGTPLAEVLRAQAQDAREAAKRDLLETAGRREVVMLVPIVFLVLPLVILFAVFPGLAVLEIAL